MSKETRTKTLRKGKSYHLDEVYGWMSLIPNECFEHSDDGEWGEDQREEITMLATVKMRYTVEVSDD